LETTTANISAYNCLYTQRKPFTATPKFDVH